MGKGSLRIIVLYCFVYIGIVGYGQISYNTDGNKLVSLEKSSKEKSKPVEVKKVNFDEDVYQREPENNETYSIDRPDLHWFDRGSLGRDSSALAGGRGGR